MISASPNVDHGSEISERLLVSPKLDIFANLRFEGPRFAEHQMPLESLHDLATFSELVLRAARTLFLLEYPNRQRWHSGRRGQRVQLVLGPIEKRCADVTVMLMHPPPLPGQEQLHFFISSDDQEARLAKARDAILESVAKASKAKKDFVSIAFDTKASPHAHMAAVSYLQSLIGFGASLHGEEFIGLREGGSDVTSEVPYDKEIGRAFGRRYLNTFTRRTKVFGRVTDVNIPAGTFDIVTTEGKPRVYVGPLFFQTMAKEAIDGAYSVEVSGTGVYRGDELLRFEASDVSLVPDRPFAMRRRCSIPVEKQLNAIGELKDGWNDGEGKAPSNKTLTNALGILTTIEDAFSIPPPYVYPSIDDDAVRCEWEAASWNIVLEIGEATTRLFASEVKGAGRGEVDDDASPAAAARVGERILQYLKAGATPEPQPLSDEPA